MQRLHQQIEFICEIDKLKNIIRHSRLIDNSRRENSSEHSWHVAMMAMTLAEHSREDIDVNRVIKMLLIHDIVEIDAGDVLAYTVDPEKAEREAKAATRIFGLLPDDQNKEFRALWDEFEASNTAEARFAMALDRLMPMIHNYRSGGDAWKLNNIDLGMALKRNACIEDASAELWQYTLKMLDDAVSEGALAPKPD